MVFRKRRPEVVVIGGLVNPQAAIAARLEGIPVVWKIVDTRTPLLLRIGFLPLVLGLADVAMTAGRRVAVVHPGLRRLGERLVSYIPPVDTRRFEPNDERRARARTELGLPQDATVVGTIGNLTPMKRHGDFIEAAAALHASCPDVRFVLLGAGYEHRADYEQSLRQKAMGLGLRLDADLIVRDPGARVAELAPAFDVFWMSSDKNSEGIPTALGEAMALGIPVVSTDAGGVAEVVDEEVGFVVPPRQPEALATATRPLLDDDELRASLGAAARARACERFALERTADVHSRAYGMALARNRVRLAARLERPPLVELGSVLRDMLSCPVCRGQLEWSDASARCTECRAAFPLIDEIPVFVTESGDAYKKQQAEFFDTADSEYETNRPHGSPRLYSWLMGEKFNLGVAAISELLPDSTVLTVCGGSGMEAEYLARAGARVIVSDISLQAARRARERARRYQLPITSIVCDIEALPFADQTIDLVYIHDGLHHLERPFAGLAEMARVATRAVSVNEPARAAATNVAVRLGMAELVEDAGNRIERLDPAEVKAKLEESGFRIVECERYAMRYRHEAGLPMRLFSHDPLFQLSRVTISAFNAIAGGAGNKMTVQAVRASASDSASAAAPTRDFG
jgi:glycosyltransferase involved in cell wall biosynthesis/ubiquinone/menaquinone biosynthesis C-methylase UbiE/uncharacterized protein YbaR (Trm112 family)